MCKETKSKRIPFDFTPETARVYKRTFYTDIVEDMRGLIKAIKKANKSRCKTTSKLGRAIFENMAWCAAKTADPDAPGIEE